MKNKNYYIIKNNKKRELVSFDIDKLEGYRVHPKTKKANSISVNKIVFVNSEFSEKIIRKKIDIKITYLLNQLKIIDEDESGDNEGTIRRNLMDAEKFRLHIMNDYLKYLGNTYAGLTLKKMEIIIEQLRYKLYYIDEIKRQIMFQNMIQEEEKEKNHRGR